MIWIIISVFATSHCQTQQSSTLDLESGFINPPHFAKPKTWMHAMSGNMSKEGLTKDLESMAEVGIGGLLLFNVTQGIPLGDIVYNSPEHHEMIKHAASEAERLGLSFGVHNCDGWSSSGGPWVTPEESMKMVVWSDTVVQGGQKINVRLIQPTTRENFYEDIVVIAYPALDSEIADLDNPPIITASDPNLDIQIISDGKIDRESKIIAHDSVKPWIQFEYAAPKAIRSAMMVFNDRFGTAELQISRDGVIFQSVRELFKVRTGKGEWAINDHFEAMTSCFFRLQLHDAMTIKEVDLVSTYYINNPLGRIAMARTEDVALADIGMPEPSMIIDKSDIQNLSSAMDMSGHLQTTLPAGFWTILRFGYTSTGAFNNPASAEGRGLEVDKLSRGPFKKHYDAFVKKVIDQAGPLAPNALKYVEIDSYEMGGQNWTDAFAKIFKERVGYDILPFLPLIAGRFIDSPNESDAILADYRIVISDLMTENYFGYFAELCREDGITSYIEPYGFGPLNDLDVGGKADIPMGEFWMNRPITMATSAISSAHIYGKPVISAESFTSTPEINWKGHPAMVKTSGDLAWTLGINEFMFHRFAHQSNTHVSPGMTMNRWGFHFDRTQTWWENAGSAWFKYIARGSYLLRQGVPVSDLLIFVGDGAPNSTYGRNDFSPPIPPEINFDCVNADVLIHRIIAEEGKLVLPEGTRYRVLVLKNSEAMTLRTLKKISELAAQGVRIVGERPKRLAGYLHSPAEKIEFEHLSNIVGKSVSSYDDWNSILGVQPDLKMEGKTQVNYAHRRTENEDIYFFFNPDSVDNTFKVHFRIDRKIPEVWNPMNGEIKKLAMFSHSNGSTMTSISLKPEESVFVIFREPSMGVESTIDLNANPVTSGLKCYLDNANQIEVIVPENGDYSAQLSNGRQWNVNVTDVPKPMGVKSDKWKVDFLQKHGFERSADFEALIDWKDHAEEGIKYYSGTASYHNTFDISSEIFDSGLEFILDLGQVYIVAEVKLNGQELGVLWMPPFQLDITEYIKLGENQLEVKITNQWSNRLIGEERFPAHDGGYKLDSHRPTAKMPEWYKQNKPLPEGPRSTFTTAPFYKKGDPLMPSGLLGPVRIRFNKKISDF